MWWITFLDTSRKVSSISPGILAFLKCVISLYFILIHPTFFKNNMFRLSTIFIRNHSEDFTSFFNGSWLWVSSILYYWFDERCFFCASIVWNVSNFGWTHSLTDCLCISCKPLKWVSSVAPWISKVSWHTRWSLLVLGRVSRRRSHSASISWRTCMGDSGRGTVRVSWSSPCSSALRKSQCW